VSFTRLQIVIACLLLIAVVVIFVAPSVDLDPAAMGSQQTLLLAMAALAAAGTALLALQAPEWWAANLVPTSPPPASQRPLLDLTCSRLC
jgi:hypothetical protein